MTEYEKPRFEPPEVEIIANAPPAKRKELLDKLAGQDYIRLQEELATKKAQWQKDTTNDQLGFEVAQLEVRVQIMKEYIDEIRAKKKLM